MVISVLPENLIFVLTTLKLHSCCQYSCLSAVSGVDYPQRERRFENWEIYSDPAFDDWLELLDGVRRRIPRRKMEPADEQRLVRTIREKFPDMKDQV